MKLEQIAYALGTSTAVGGIIGYVRTQSVPSIVAGLAVGSIYLLSGMQIQRGGSYGLHLGFLASTLLAGSSVQRLAKAGVKPVPVLLLVIATTGFWNYRNAWVNRV